MHKKLHKISSQSIQKNTRKYFFSSELLIDSLKTVMLQTWNKISWIQKWINGDEFFWPFTSLRQNEIYKIILGSKFSKFTNSFLIFFFRKLLKSPKIFSTISSRGSRKMLGFQITLELLLQNVKQVFSLIQTLSLKYQSTKKVFNFFWIGNKVAACQQIFSSTKSFFWQKELEQGFSSKIFFSKSFFILNSKFLHFVNFFFFSSSSHL